MVANSAISWTDHTWNPWIGCTKVSPACDRCYAEQWAKRYGRAQWGDHPRERTSANTWRQPMKWNRETPGAFVFCASLADIFDNQVDPQWRADAFDVMRATPALTYLLLTKRPQNIEKLAAAAGGLPANAMLGCTVVTPDEAERDIPKLLAAKAALAACGAFVSIEPMLAPMSVKKFLWPVCAYWPAGYSLDEAKAAGKVEYKPQSLVWAGCVFLDWVIVGGESGAGARPIEADWVRAIRDECQNARVPFHFKQWGGFTAKAGGKEIDGREWCERPEPKQKLAA